MRSLIGNPSLGPEIGQLGYSGLVSLELAPSGLDVGPRFAFEAMYGFVDLAPQLRLDLGARASFGFHSGGGDVSLWLADIVPDAKIRYALTDQLGVYGDLGLGLALMHTSVPDFVINNVTYSASSTDLALTFQLGAGVAYAVTPNINLLGEIRFDFYTKSDLGTFISIPTIGLEFH